MNELTPMSCQDAFERLDEFVDRELSPEDRARVEAHLARCQACAREFTFEESVLENLKVKLRRISVPADLVARVTDALTRERRRL